jgi:hypothetical protein
MAQRLPVPYSRAAVVRPNSGPATKTRAAAIRDTCKPYGRCGDGYAVLWGDDYGDSAVGRLCSKRQFSESGLRAKLELFWPAARVGAEGSCSQRAVRSLCCEILAASSERNETLCRRAAALPWFLEHETRSAPRYPTRKQPRPREQTWY